jgi:hypothetical protein
MFDELIIKLTIVSSNLERNLKNQVYQISQAGKPVFEMTLKKELFKK